MGRLQDKWEKIMVSITFAEEGLSKEAIAYLKDEPQPPVYSINEILKLKGMNIWYGVAAVEE